MPLRESFDEKELAGLRTPAVRAFERNGLLWLTLSDATPPLKEFLGVLWDELGWYGMDRFEIRYRVAPDLNANWKVVVDAINETWHVPFSSTHQAPVSPSPGALLATTCTFGGRRSISWDGCDVAARRRSRSRHRRILIHSRRFFLRKQKCGQARNEDERTQHVPYEHEGQ